MITQKQLFIAVQYITPQHTLSRLIGFIARCRIKFIKNIFIKKFIARYNVDMSLAQQANYQNYENFNAFFTRALKPDARPIDANSNSIVCPADGAISEIGYIDHGTLLQAKGRTYSVVELIGGNQALANEFTNGAFATVYLSPKDYHRVHMPITGTLREMIFVPGQLFSVNQTTAQMVPNVFARNERVVCVFDTQIGTVAVILVGAMIVASIETVWAGVVAPMARKTHSTCYHGGQNITLNKGDEVGRFLLGSTAIMLFPEHKIKWAEHLQAASPVKMGEAVGAIE